MRHDGRILAVFVLLVGVCAACGGSGGGSNAAPTVTFLAPNQANQLALGASLDITYSDNDPDSAATTTIVADIDGDLATTGDQVVIAAGRPEQDGAAQTITWDTTGVPSGTYRLFAITTDGVSTVVADAGVAITLGSGNTPPTVTVGPDGDLSICVGLTVEIPYTDDDPDDAATTSLFADADGDPASGLIPIELDRAEQNGAPQTASWDTTGVAPGTYFVIARSSDGTNPDVFATATGTVTVTADPVLQFVVQEASGNESEFARRGSVFADGSFIVGGSFGSGVGSSSTFGSGDPNETTLGTDGDFDWYLARYNADGTLAWARGGGLEERSLASIYQIATYADGSCIAVGHFRGDLTIAGNTMEADLGRDDFFIAKFDANGTALWAHSVGGEQQDLALAIAGFPDGSCVITGGLGSTSTFGGGGPNATTIDVEFLEAKTFFIAKYDGDGNFQWVRTQSTEGSDLGTGIAGFPDGSSVAYWHRNSSGPFGIGEYYVTRYDADGAELWNRATGAANAVVFGGISGHADGSFFVTGNAGFYFPSTTFGEGDPNETTLMPVDNDDIFVARYNADGTLAWARMIGGEGNDFGDSVAALPGGGCVVTGAIDEETTIAGRTLTPAGNFDAVLLHLTADGSVACVHHWGNASNDRAWVTPFADGSALVGGNFENSIVVAGMPLTSNSGFDFFVGRFSALP